METGTFAGVDGAELFFRVIEPAGPPKAAVILVHGHGDHSGGLQNITDSLVKKRYSVYAFDLRGHGKSYGKRGYIRSWNEFRGDLHQFRKLVKTDQPNLPLYIAGHSLGGLITLDYCLDYSDGLSGIITISPAISYEVTLLEQVGITILGKLKPDYSINKTQLNRKKSPHYVKFYSDGLRHNIITPGLGRGLVQTISRVLHHPQWINLPFLLQYGLEDKITPPDRLSHFFDAVASREKQIVEYPSAKHRPFDEAGREKVLGDMVDWLDQQIDKRQSFLFKKAGNRL